MKKTLFYLLIFLALPLFGQQNEKQVSFPEPLGIVNDYDTVFTKKQREELSKILYDYNIKTTRQIAVITIDKIAPYQSIQKYATDIGSYWGVGTKEKNNGLVILLCNPIRQIGIATGKGTEKILTDAICKDVIDKIMIPEFRKGDFYNGVKKGIEELIKKWGS